MDPMTIAALASAGGSILKGLNGGGGSSSPSGMTSVNVNQSNSQNQSVNLGNPYIPTLPGGSDLTDLYAGALGITTPAASPTTDSRYSPLTGGISLKMDWVKILMYVAAGLGGYFLIRKLRV